MRISHLSAECVPFAKTGGLGDVAGALPKAQAARGQDVDVWMPFFLEAAQWYRKRLEWPEQATDPITVSIMGQPYTVGVLRGTLPGSDVPVYFVAHDPLFHRRSIYAKNDQGVDDGLWRFSLFARAAIEGMKSLGRKPEIMHCHDWHPALAPMLGAWLSWRDTWFNDVASVVTIHNIAYQGMYGLELFPALGLPDEVLWGGQLEFDGIINLLKGAICAADVITTVSPTFAHEITTPEGGYRLDGILRSRQDRLMGIMNGIDPTEWSPETDKYILAHYSKNDLRGKADCRAYLCHLAGFEPADPGMILGAIGRLVEQKGFDLLLEAAPELIRRGIRIVMLGSGEPALEGAMKLLEAHHPRRFRAFLGYDEALSHKIEAGADTIVMPSRFEPCGLTQLYSLAYGTVPIVRNTGGLADSVTGYNGWNLGEATGFIFNDASVHSLAAEVLHAQHIFFQRDIWHRIIENGMSQDFSWDHAAILYDEAYSKARAVRGL